MLSVKLANRRACTQLGMRTNRALTAEEIRQLHDLKSGVCDLSLAQARSRQSEDLGVHYPLNEKEHSLCSFDLADRATFPRSWLGVFSVGRGGHPHCDHFGR